MNKTDTGGAAFPAFTTEGMALRDYFAAKALHFIATKKIKNLDEQTALGRDYKFTWDEVAEVSYAVADAMLRERSK